jgi:hypothetical protein
MMGKSSRRGSRVTTPRTGRACWLALVLSFIGGSLACTPYSTQKLAPDGAIAMSVNCSVTGAYEFKTIDALDTPGSAPFWTAADCTTGASMNVNEVALSNGGQCGSTAALEITASHNDQWGSLTGYNNFGPRDGSAYQGISFWAVARTGAVAFTILLDDPNTADDTGITPPIGNCTTYPTVDAGCGAPVSGTIVDPGTGMILSSGTSTPPPLPNQCGNSYATTLAVTNQWQFYTLPYGRFQQALTPNAVANNAHFPVTGMAAGTTLITSQLLVLTMRLPKGDDVDLLMTDLSFYRAKGSGPRDGGGN